MKIIWMTDPHFLTEPAWGLDLEARLVAAIAHINAHQSDAELCIISGDLTNDGDAPVYDALRARLDRLAMPYYPLVGNHDDRALTRALLPQDVTLDSDFIQYGLETAAGVILCLDTLKDDAVDGEGALCAARMDWLAERLEHHRNRPVFIFMHHPPMDVEMAFDQIRLTNGGAFLDLVSRHGNVRQLFMGHVHRPITGSARGIPFTTLRATSFQAPGPGPVWDWNSFTIAEEAPAYGVVYLKPDSVIVHPEQFCDAAYGRLDAGG